VSTKLDDLDKEWLARPHSADEYRHEIKNALERCAMYSAKVDRLEAEIERLKAVALQAQNAAIDLAKKSPRLTVDDAAQAIGIMNERSARMKECRNPSEACLYPRCTIEDRCNLLMAGLCSGPRAADPQQVGR